MGNIIDMAKWRDLDGGVVQSACSPCGSDARDGFDNLCWKYDLTRHERPNAVVPSTGKSMTAASSLTSWRDIRKTGTGLAEEFRVFAYAGGLGDNLDDLDRDLRSLRSALDLLKNRVGGECVIGCKGFHVVLGSHGASAWVDNHVFGRVLALPANFTIAEAILLIEQRFGA